MKYCLYKQFDPEVIPTHTFYQPYYLRSGTFSKKTKDPQGGKHSHATPPRQTMLLVVCVFGTHLVPNGR